MLIPPFPDAIDAAISFNFDPFANFTARFKSLDFVISLGIDVESADAISANAAFTASSESDFPTNIQAWEFPEVPAGELPPCSSERPTATAE